MIESALPTLLPRLLNDTHLCLLLVLLFSMLICATETLDKEFYFPLINSPKNLAMENDSVVTGCVRPVRKCRVTTKASYADENDYPKRSTRQSKKPAYSNISDGFSFGEDKRHSLPQPSNATVKLEVETSTDNVTKVKTCASLVAKQKSEDKSPSVRDRTKAYESMLKIRMSESPVLKHSGLVGTNKVPSPLKVSGSPKGQMSGHSSNPECGRSVKDTSVKQISQVSYICCACGPLSS